jgi:AAA family ATP:ADP antiporter
MALQASMAAVVCIACVAIMLQQHITNQAEAEAAAIRHRHQHRHNSMHSSIASGADLTRASSPAIDALSPSPQPLQQQLLQNKEKPKTSLKDSFRMLAASVEIRCLATMSLAQGLCNSLMEFAWKCHMRILYPSPADFTAFLGRYGLQSL